ncbi:tetratricopeptide repeat protein [Psychrobacter sp. FDAARGOS_221]|uniref:tetratricopeptide repeat protein n=1 Tax=Psychrobacter sp. FDAARGOS_221 TaxID=1975705 RepID=UPI00187D25AB|nr:tetratricopeptide repeat protein [Psychrobacter sp. FDAARGOS_221]
MTVNNEYDRHDSCQEARRYQYNTLEFKPRHSFKRLILTASILLGVPLLGCQTNSSVNGFDSQVTSQTAGQPNASSLNNTNITASNRSKSGTKSNQQQAAEIRTQIAAQYLRDRQLDEASRQLQMAFNADADYAPAYDMMGVLLQQEGSADNLLNAEAYFLKAIALDAQFMQAHNNYGVYLSKVGKPQQAIEHFKIAGSALGYYGRIGALENLGLTALKVGDRQLATDTFVRVLGSERGNITAHIELIDILIDSKQVEQAKNLYNELLILLNDQPNRHPRIVSQGIRLSQLSADS